MLSYQGNDLARPKKKGAVASLTESVPTMVKSIGETLQLSIDDISSLYLEGSAIPVNTRMTSFLLNVLESTRESVKEPSKKKRKNDEETHTAVGKLKKGMVSVSPADCPNSSDEEADNDSQALRTSSRKKSPCDYRGIPDFQKAKIPEIWPPKTLGEKPRLQPIVDAMPTQLNVDVSDHNIVLEVAKVEHLPVPVMELSNSNSEPLSDAVATAEEDIPSGEA